MPARAYDSQLKAMLSFYNSVTHVTPEGDSLVSEDTLEGLGTAGSSRSLLHSLFGSILRVAFPFGYTQSPPQTHPIKPTGSSASLEVEKPLSTSRNMDAVGQVSRASLLLVEESEQRRPDQKLEGQQTINAGTKNDSDGTLDYRGQPSTATEPVEVKKKFRLTQFIPDPGYFLAGAIAGGVSRTATAPLDRLKVYLLVNTNATSSETAAAALKRGKPMSAVTSAVRPIGDAVRDLFRSGGLKGFFAGEPRYNPPQLLLCCCSST